MAKRNNSSTLTSISAKVGGNNITWLRSWGCEVREYEHFVVVKNDVFGDYNALFDLAENTRLEEISQIIDL